MFDLKKAQDEARQMLSNKVTCSKCGVSDLMFIFYVSPLNSNYILCDLCEGQSKSNEVLLQVWS